MRWCLLILLLFGVQITFAQENTVQGDCNSLLSEHSDIELELEPFDYVPACETGMDCVTEEYSLCPLQIAAELPKQCDRSDLFCQNEAFLKTTTVILGYLSYPTDSDDFDEIINAFSAGEFDEALALHPDPKSIDVQYSWLPWLFYGRGLILELLDEPESALEAYNRAVEMVPYQPLLHYTRGLLLGRSGKNTEASFETAWLVDYLTAFAPDLLYAVEPLTQNYPLDTSQISTWIRYPTVQKGIYPGGYHYVDRTQAPPTTSMIGFYDQNTTMLAIDVSEMRYTGYYGDTLNTYIFQETEDGVYTHRFEMMWTITPDTLTLRFEDGLIFGQQYGYGGESYGVYEFILAPEGVPDPRRGYGKPICEGGVISRLRPGMYVNEMASVQGFAYAEEPGGDYNLYFDDGNRGDQTDFSTYPWLEVSVTENFTCIDDQLWWEVTDGLGHTGWRAENEGNEYRFGPKDGVLELFYCPSAPPTRLYVRGEGRVLPGLGKNNLRSEPGSSSTLVTQIPENDSFTVLDGPVCAENMAWWQVEYGDSTGWTAEGDTDGYWLEPILPEWATANH